MSNEQKLNLLTERFLTLKQEISILIKNSKNKRNHLQNYLYFAHFPLFTFTESIIILYKHGKFNSAHVLLRSLIEAHINIIYHQVGNTERKLAISARSMLGQRLRTLNHLERLIVKYPNLESTNPEELLNKEYLTKTKEKIETDIHAVEKGNNLNEKDTDLMLKSKAIDCDSTNLENVGKGHFEFIYALRYRYLSSYTHLDIEGLQMFVNQDIDGKHLFSDGDSNNGKVGITDSIGICVALVKDLYEHKVLDGDMPKIVREIENLLKDLNVDLSK